MGTTTEKLQAIRSSKADIKSAIEGHDVEVGAAPLSEYGNKIRSIRSRITTSQSYCVGRWPEWTENNPTATRVDGDRSLALDWYPVLVDMSPVEGETMKKPVGYLKRNNFLRFEDGSFAPTVGITEAQRAECDVDLYLDDQQQQLYCEAGGFNAETFYNEYGMTQKLYDANGDEVRILRPWETTETKYSIFVTRKDTVNLIDNEESSDGGLLRGIIADDGKVDGIKGRHPLVPTGIAAGPCTELSGQLRCFFFQYMTDEVGCKGLAPTGGLTGTGELFFGDGTYPRTLDNDIEGTSGLKPNDDGKGVNQAKNAKKARACNYDTSKPYPVAEGGWHAWNVFISCLEVAYGTKYIHSPNMFSSGISSNDNGNNEANWLNYGGVRLKVHTNTAWTYTLWSTNNSIIYHNASSGRTDMSNLINRYAPKMWCMEAQMALSMAAELGVAPGVEFDFYGKTYSYQNVSGATTLLNGRMNARLYRTRVMTLNAYNSSKAATMFDIQCRLRAPIAEGVNISGDFVVYMGGGHEVITQYANSSHRVKSYIECDQTKWKDINHTVSQSQDFNFQADYEQLATGIMNANACVMLRCPYGTWRLYNGVNMSTGECCYHYEASLGTSANVRYRAGVRVRGYANAASSSPRCVISTNLASYCSANSGPSAQVLIDTRSDAVANEGDAVA